MIVLGLAVLILVLIDFCCCWISGLFDYDLLVLLLTCDCLPDSGGCVLYHYLLHIVCLPLLLCCCLIWV